MWIRGAPRVHIVRPPHEAAPGPTEFRNGKAIPAQAATEAPQGALTLQGIRETLREIVARRSPTDPSLTYLDGLTLLGADDADRLPDDLHPDAEGYRLIAGNFVDRFASLLRHKGLASGSGLR